MTPCDLVLSRYALPERIKIRPLQVEAVNLLATPEGGGVYLDVGGGKTLVQTLVSLYLQEAHGYTTTVVLMPPILIPQWGSWLREIIQTSTQRPLTVTEYAGTPAQRKKLDLNAPFVCMSLGVFKKDFDILQKHYQDSAVSIAVDEANSLANVGTDSHRKVKAFGGGRPVHLLTGTPINNPMDGYGLIRFTNPTAYRDLRHFERCHVEEYDFYDKPVKFQNLDLLAQNLEHNSVRILFEDMYPETEAPLYQEVKYRLDPQHLDLYSTLADEKLLALEGGGKVDGTSASKLTHALGQIVCNWGHFAGDPSKKSKVVEVIQQRLDELGFGKLVVSANYRMTIAMLAEEFKGVGAVTVNGDCTPKEKQAALKTFISDAACRLIILHPKSAGVGVDGLQHVCHHLLLAEPLQQPRDFTQLVARLKRTGQTKRVVVTLPAALRTLQPAAYRALLKNDENANQVVRSVADLRDLLHGKT